MKNRTTSTSTPTPTPKVKPPPNITEAPIQLIQRKHPLDVVYGTRNSPKRYGELTELSSSDESPDLGQPKKRRAGTSIASYSPPRQSNTGTTVSPPHSVIPTITPYQNQIAENFEDPPQAQEEDASHGGVLAIYDQDQPERPLQPHEL